MREDKREGGKDRYGGRTQNRVLEVRLPHHSQAYYLYAGMGLQSWHSELLRFTYLKSYNGAPWKNLSGYLKLIARGSLMNKELYLTILAQP